jgi:hypothetical protein
MFLVLAGLLAVVSRPGRVGGCPAGAADRDLANPPFALSAALVFVFWLTVVGGCGHVVGEMLMPSTA